MAVHSGSEAGTVGDPSEIPKAEDCEIIIGDLPSSLLCRNLRSRRQALGLTQAVLARRMTAGGRPMSNGTINEIESPNETRAPTVDELIAFAEVLDTSPVALLAGRGDDEFCVWPTANLSFASRRAYSAWLTFGDGWRLAMERMRAYDLLMRLRRAPRESKEAAALRASLDAHLRDPVPVEIELDYGRKESRET